MTILKKWWPSIATVLAAIMTAVFPQIQAFAAAHPNYAVSILAIWGVVLHQLQSPGAPPAPPTGIASKMLSLFLVWTLCFSLVACTTDQVLADLGVLFDIVNAIQPEIAAVDPAAGAEVARLYAIADNGLVLVNSSYDAFKKANTQTNLDAVRFAVQQLTANLGQVLATVQIRNPATKDKVTRWVVLITSSLNAILAAIPALNMKIMSTHADNQVHIKLNMKLVPRPDDLRLQWRNVVCDTASCAGRVH